MPVTSFVLPPAFAENTYAPPFNPYSSQPACLVTGETQTVSANSEDPIVIVPRHAPFFTNQFSVSFQPLVGAPRTLNETEDFYFVLPFLSASRACQQRVVGGIEVLNRSLSGTYTLNYTTLGAGWIYRVDLDEANRLTFDGRAGARAWEQYAIYQQAFPAVYSAWDMVDGTKLTAILAALQAAHGDFISAQVERNQKELQAATHVFDFNGPHGRNKALVGLSNVANYPPATDAQAADPSNDVTYITPRQLSIVFATSVPDATDASVGIAALNLGESEVDATNATDVLTAQAFINLASNSAGRIGGVLNRGQKRTRLAPWTDGLWPKTWVGQSYANAVALAQGIADSLSVEYVELNQVNGDVYHPSGTTLSTNAISAQG